MEKQISKMSYDIQSVVLCSIISSVIIIPILVFTINFNNFTTFIILIIFVVLSTISLLAIYFHTRVEIYFKKSEIICKKKKKELKKFKWNEIKIEYLGIDELIFLRCFCIHLSYYDKKTKKYIDLLIPDKKEEFTKIMALRKNNI